MPTVSHPFLNDGVDARAYQIRSLKNALTSSCLMVMPTGFGKTAVEWMMMAEFLRKSKKKILLIAPTTGLVEQQQRMAQEMLKIDDDLIVRYTGETSPSKRKAIWDAGTILIATSQVIRNDATNNLICLGDVSLIIFDEAHHATGNHAYAQVGDLYLKSNPKGFTLGATASPGSTKSAILEVARRLGIDRLDISKREDSLLQPYAVELDNKIIGIDLPDALITLIYPLQEHQAREIESLRRMGFMAPVENLTSKIITETQMNVSRAIERRDSRGYNAARKVSDLRRMHMLLDLVKTQGIMPALSYLDKAEDDGRTGDRGTNRFIGTNVIHNFRKVAKELGEIHPKCEIVCEMVKDKVSKSPESRILIFTEYRYTVHNLTKILGEIPGVKASQFIGQSSSGKKKGMTQKQQLQRLSEFRSGEINVLVATSVGEEGLDVPSADLVLMYEPVPSAIRAIQRRGRTARQSSGTVKTLIARNTRDEFVNMASRKREERMYKNLETIQRTGRIPIRKPAEGDVLSEFKINLGEEMSSAQVFLDAEKDRLKIEKPIQEKMTQQTISPKNTIKTENITVPPKDKRPRNQTGLESFLNPKSANQKLTSKSEEIEAIKAADSVIDELTQSIDLNVILDHRESSSTLSAYLRSMGMTVNFEYLDIGDISLHGDILIERKTARDLLTSIIDERLFKQCKKLHDSANSPLLLIELGEIGNSVHPNAVLGALAHVTLDLGIPVMMTKDTMESAYFISLIAKNNKGFAEKLRRNIRYESVDEKSIDSKCEAASAEISAMIDGGEKSILLLSKWTSDGKSKQIDMFSNIVGIDKEKSRTLMERFSSIIEVLKAEKRDLEEILNEEEINLISQFFA